jgi:LPXTG-site transpeptidase (sortase) family protein
MKKLSVFLVMFAFAFGPLFQIGYSPAYAGGGIPFCSDGIDNDGNGKIDDLDPTCHTDGDASNALSYDPLKVGEIPVFIFPICSDFLDNDSDGLIDDMDPACHTDRDASNPFSYDPLIDTENDPIIIPPVVITGGGGSYGSNTQNIPPVPTPTPVVEEPKGEVLGVETVKEQTCGGDTGRPCILQKTGGIPFNRITENNKAVKIAKTENNNLVISKIKLNKPVLQMQDIKALRSQTWILPWTSTPDKGGNTVIVGHTYNLIKGKYSKNAFWDLETLEKGDTVEMTWKGKKYTYIITEKGTAKPEEWQLENQTEKAMLTLYGCGRKDNTFRNYIKAELIEDIKN